MYSVHYTGKMRNCQNIYKYRYEPLTFTHGLHVQDVTYLWCEFPVGDDPGNQTPFSVAGGIMDHLLPE